MGIHDLGLHVVQQEPCNDLKPQTAPQSQAMGWETLVARWGPCMQPRRGPTMGEKIDPACPAGNVSYSQVTAQLKELPGYL